MKKVGNDLVLVGALFVFRGSSGGCALFRAGSRTGIHKQTHKYHSIVRYISAGTNAKIVQSVFLF